MKRLGYYSQRRVVWLEGSGQTAGYFVVLGAEMPAELLGVEVDKVYSVRVNNKEEKRMIIFRLK